MRLSDIKTILHAEVLWGEEHLDRDIGKIVGVHRSTVHGIHFRVLPFSEGLCACGNGKSRKQSGNEMFLHGK